MRCLHTLIQSYNYSHHNVMEISAQEDEEFHKKGLHKKGLPSYPEILALVGDNSLGNQEWNRVDHSPRHQKMDVM